MEMKANNMTVMVFLAVLILSIAVGTSRCAKIAKADDLPPLLLEYFLPSIQNHPFSIGLPPDPIE